jgi:hypothetical protein
MVRKKPARFRPGRLQIFEFFNALKNSITLQVMESRLHCSRVLRPRW